MERAHTAIFPNGVRADLVLFYRMFLASSAVPKPLLLGALLAVVRPLSLDHALSGAGLHGARFLHFSSGVVVPTPDAL